MILGFDKNKLLKISTSRIAYHVYFWTFFFCSWYLLVRTAENTALFTMGYTLSIVGMAMFPVYIHFYFFERYFSRKRYTIYIALLITIIVVFGLLNYKFFSHVFDDKNGPLTFMLNVSFLIVITTALKFVKHGIRQRLMMQEIKAKHLQTELDLLKTQIHPHFLFNTLNNLYGLARRKDTSAAEGISQLSHLMRYMIYDSSVNRIDLEKEIRQIQRLIDLQRLRFTEEDAVDIQFRVEGDVTHVQIPPMLLIPFVENAFKHGISLQELSFIHIHLYAGKSEVAFSVKNSNHDGKKINDTSDPGVGLRNVRRRLELLYPDAHHLTVRNTRRVFEINLILRN